MKHTFNNKVIAITGAGSGIGRALALNLASKGARLALCDINEESLQETIDLLPANTDSKAYVVDVSSKESVYQFADEVKRDFSTAHYIINNAGVSIFGTVEHIDETEIHRVIDINMWGVLYGTKAFLPMMLQQKEGCIVNLSSVFGLAASPAQAAYTMSKFAVRGLTEVLWSELQGSGVRAVSVHPGGINTNIDNTTPFTKASNDYEQKVSDVSSALMTTSPQECANEIVAGLQAGKNRLLVGSGAMQLGLITRLLPNSYFKLLLKKLGL